MKIGMNTNIEALASKIQQNAAQAALAKQTGTAAEAVKSGARSAQAGVPVTVSSSIRSLEKGASSASDIDMAKVNAMRQAIANGSFSINAGAIADRLLGDTGLFLGVGQV